MEKQPLAIKQSTNNDFLKGVLIGLIFFLLILLAFILGLRIGQRDFGPRAIPPMFHPFMKIPKEGIVPKRIRGHGLVGTIDSVSKDSFIVKSRWGELVTVLVDKSTQFWIDGKKANFTDLNKGKKVLVIGRFDEEKAAIKALTIRIF